MKINSAFGLEQYKSISKAAPKQDAATGKVKQADVAQAANTDKVSFSGDAAFKAELVRQAQAQSLEVEGAASREHLESLQRQVEQGEYYVGADVLAGKILDKLT